MRYSAASLLNRRTGEFAGHRAIPADTVSRQQLRMLDLYPRNQEAQLNLQRKGTWSIRNMKIAEAIIGRANCLEIDFVIKRNQLFHMFHWLAICPRDGCSSHFCAITPPESLTEGNRYQLPQTRPYLRLSSMIRSWTMWVLVRGHLQDACLPMSRRFAKARSRLLAVAQQSTLYLSQTRTGLRRTMKPATDSNRQPFQKLPSKAAWIPGLRQDQKMPDENSAAVVFLQNTV